MRLNRLVVALTPLALALLAPAAASAETFDPSDEFKLKDWVPIHLGPLDLSINRAVVYLFKWLVSSDGQKEGTDLQYAPLPTAVQALAQSNLKLIKAGGAAILS